MNDPIRRRMEAGPFPVDDGWGWLYRILDRIAPAGRRLRGSLCRYFLPNRLETWRRGLLYRLLGVQWFGSVIPTGGVRVRRITGARMAPYTLSGTSLRGARAFYYRTCVFEALHMPFCLTLFGLSTLRALEGRWDLALEDMAVNLLFNIYPIMHHRRTRLRIVQLITRGHDMRRRLEDCG